MNDPNVPVWQNGEYRLFCPHNPNAAGWARLHWGDAVSRDQPHGNFPDRVGATTGGAGKHGA